VGGQASAIGRVTGVQGGVAFLLVRVGQALLYLRRERVGLRVGLIALHVVRRRARVRLLRRLRVHTAAVVSIVWILADIRVWISA